MRGPARRRSHWRHRRRGRERQATSPAWTGRAHGIAAPNPTCAGRSRRRKYQAALQVQGPSAGRWGVSPSALVVFSPRATATVSDFLPSPDQAIPRDPARLALALVTTGAALHRSIDAWTDQGEP